MLIKGAETDESLPYLQELLEQGFNEVQWVWNENYPDVCQTLDGDTWELEDFISNLYYDAPIFEKSHVNCTCYLIVRNTSTGEEVKVNYQGVMA